MYTATPDSPFGQHQAAHDAALAEKSYLETLRQQRMADLAQADKLAQQAANSINSNPLAVAEAQARAKIIRESLPVIESHIAALSMALSTAFANMNTLSRPIENALGEIRKANALTIRHHPYTHEPNQDDVSNREQSLAAARRILKKYTGYDDERIVTGEMVLPGPAEVEQESPVVNVSPVPAAVNADQVQRERAGGWRANLAESLRATFGL